MSTTKKSTAGPLAAIVIIGIVLVGGFFAIRNTDFFDDLTNGDSAEAAVDTGPAFSTTTPTRSNVADEVELVGELRYQDRVSFVHRADPEEVTITEEVPVAAAPGPAAAPGANPGGPDQAGGAAPAVAQTEIITTVVEEPAFRTITGLPTPGQIIAPGDVLYETDSTPVFAVAGEVAAWRELSTLTNGSDVAQLQRYLIDGGWADDTLVDDGIWTTATTTAVQTWQDETGQLVTGTVALGDIWFIATPIRITQVPTSEGIVVGDGEELFAYTSTNRAIEVTVTELPEGLLEADTLNTRLPDRSSATTAVRSVRGTDTGFDIVLDVELPDEGVPAVNNVEVTTSWITSELVDALTLPPEAIRRLDDGAYVVDVLDGEDVQQVPVNVLGQAGRVVAIDGVNEAQLVIIP